MTVVRTTSRAPAQLLELDADLGALLPGHRLSAAREGLLVPTHRLRVGHWDVSRLSTAQTGHIGLLLVDGLVARDVLMDTRRSTELIGPGDLIRPWRRNPDERLLQHDVHWQILAEAIVAVLDRHIVDALGRFPEVAVALLERADQRAARLAEEKAIAQLRTVEARLMALFWLLAERWGRRTRDGVAVPLALSHRVLADVIGARRPTVSTALSRLASQGELRRRSDRSWLLTGEPVGRPRMPSFRA